MDLREKKTKRNIQNAFLALRSRKQLERITVKELSEAAEISKATFYLHYRDIYDLSDRLQAEVLKNIIDAIPDPALFLTDPAEAHNILRNAFLANKSLTDILFSGTQEAVLPLYIEKEMKKSIFTVHPEIKDDIMTNTSLTFLIMGAFYAYLHNSGSGCFPEEEVSAVIKSLLTQYQLAFPEIFPHGIINF